MSGFFQLALTGVLIFIWSFFFFTISEDDGFMAKAWAGVGVSAITAASILATFGTLAVIWGW